MIELQFDTTGFLVGASIKQYLLEQTRVVKQNPGERNFHVFYYLCAGADKTERDHYALAEVSSYHYINQSGIYKIADVNSKFMYIELKRALATAGLTPPEIYVMFKLMAAILWLGNIDFEGEEESKVENPDVLKWTAYLLQVNADDLGQALTHRENQIKGEIFMVPLTKQEVCQNRFFFTFYFLFLLIGNYKS